MEGAGRRVQRIEQRDHAQAVGTNDDLWQGRRGRRQDRAVALKDPKDWKIAGKPLKRLDTPPKVTGEQVYGIDLKLPGMLCVAIKDCPCSAASSHALMPPTCRACLVSSTS